MSNNISLKGFEEILIAVIQSDPSVREVRYLDQWKADTKREDQYPLMVYDFIQSEVSSNRTGQISITYTLFLACMDKCLNDRSNIGDVLSSTNTILTYLSMKLRNSSDLREMGIRFPDLNSTITQAGITGDDFIMGCKVDLRFQIVPEFSACDLPYLPLAEGDGVYEVDNPTSVLCAEITACPSIQQMQEDIDLLFQLTGGTAGAATYVQAGVNAYTGGTASLPIVGVIGSPVFTAVTASDFISGSTNLNGIFAPIVHTHVSSAITDSSYGGNGAADADKLAKFNLEGQLAVSADNNVIAAFRAATTGVATAIEVQTLGSGQGIDIASTSGLALAASTGDNTAANFDNNSSSIPTLEVTNNGSGPLAHFENGGGTVVEVANNGSISSNATVFGIVISGNTIYSGSTDVSHLLGAAATPHTFVQAGVNVYTGGTAQLPVVGVIGSPSFTAVTASNFISGATNLSSVFAPISIQNQWLQNGTNITTGGTPNAPSANLIASPSVTNIVASNTVFGATVSGNTYWSGSTLLSTALTNLFNGLYAPISVQNTFVQAGLNMATGGTAFLPIVRTLGDVVFTSATISTSFVSKASNDISASSTKVVATTFNGSTASAGRTQFQSCLVEFDRSFIDINSTSDFSCDTTNGTTRFVVGRLGEFTGGLKVTGAGEVSTNFSAATYFSGNTSLVTSLTNVFNSLYGPVQVQGGTNISTGGTVFKPTVNLNANIALASVSATTLSATTVYEATVPLNTKYAPRDLTITRTSGTYILTLTDDSRVIYLSGGSAQNLVVPRNAAVALPIGSQVAVVQSGAGQVSFSADTGVTLLSYSSMLKTLGQYAGASLVKLDTNEWSLVGNLTT